MAKNQVKLNDKINKNNKLKQDKYVSDDSK